MRSFNRILDFPTQCIALYAGHHDVADDEINHVVFQITECLLAVGNVDDLIIGLKDVAKIEAQVVVVFDNHQSLRR